MEQKTTIPAGKNVKKLEGEVLRLYGTISKVPIIEETRFSISKGYKTVHYSGGHFVPDITQEDINSFYYRIKVNTYLKRRSSEELQAIISSINDNEKKAREAFRKIINKEVEEGEILEEQISILEKLKLYAEQDLRYKATLLSPDSKVYVLERGNDPLLPIIGEGIETIILKSRGIKSAILAYKP